MFETTIIRICEFAREIQSEKRRTAQELYFDTGYSECFEEITQQQIEALISHDSSLIDEWLSFSEDSRRTPAWGLGKQGSRWTVFRMLDGGVCGYSISFGSPAAACALMIRMEMEELRLTTT